MPSCLCADSLTTVKVSVCEVFKSDISCLVTLSATASLILMLLDAWKTAEQQALIYINQYLAAVQHRSRQPTTEYADNDKLIRP